MNTILVDEQDRIMFLLFCDETPALLWDFMNRVVASGTFSAPSHSAEKHDCRRS